MARQRPLLPALALHIGNWARNGRGKSDVSNQAATVSFGGGSAASHCLAGPCCATVTLLPALRTLLITPLFHTHRSTTNLEKEENNVIGYPPVGDE